MVLGTNTRLGGAFHVLSQPSIWKGERVKVEVGEEENENKHHSE